MEEKVIESLEYLWFFNNVFSSTKFLLTQIGQVSDDQQNSPKQKGPINPIVRNDQTESPIAKSVVPKCPKCGEFSGGMSPRKEEEVRENQEQEKRNGDQETKMKRPRHNKNSKKSKAKCVVGNRKVLGEVIHDFGVDLKFWGLDYEEIKTPFEENLMFSVVSEMPPFNDGMAMKQHLKSWAHAVACTVR